MFYIVLPFQTAFIDKVCVFILSDIESMNFDIVIFSVVYYNFIKVTDERGVIMKKTVKPTSWQVILFGALAVVCIGISVAEFFDTLGTSAATLCLDALAIGVFVYQLIKYCSREKIDFDEASFTVGGKTYGFDEITKVTVNNEQVLRSVSTLRIRLYIDEDEIASFTKDDKGGKDFIAVMKKQGVSVSIDV